MAQSVTASSLLDSLGANASVPTSSSLDVDLRDIFESRRPVRRLIEVGHTATIPMKILNSEFQCVVCLCIIRECTAVMECLHRFCSSCIEKCLRYGKKECPACRVPCASRRNLRKDPAFDQVIQAIYPDLDKAEANEEALTQEVLKSSNVRKFGEIASKGARQQRDQAKRSTKRPASPPPSGPFTSHSAQLPIAKRPRNPNKPEPISFSMVQHPQLSQSSTLGPMFALPHKFMRTSRYITVLLLKKWLQLKLVNKTIVKKETPAADGEEKKEATKQESETKMEDVATSTTATSAAAASTDSTTVTPPVRFVLYVRAFDTSLLHASADMPIAPEIGGEEVYVPLASDLTLDYIEEHMWNVGSNQNLQSANKLNDSLKNLPPNGDATPLLKQHFAQSFTKCQTHRKAKQPCPEDCVERVAVWTDYLASESEKVKKWREAMKASEVAATANALQAAQFASATGQNPEIAAQAAVAQTPIPPPVFQPQPFKKQRLVLYYSIVGADGQILLNAPSIAPDIVQKYIIPTNDEEDTTASTQQPAAYPMQATTITYQPQPTSATPAAGFTQQPTSSTPSTSIPNDQPVPMQMDEDTVPQLPSATTDAALEG